MQPFKKLCGLAAMKFGSRATSATAAAAVVSPLHSWLHAAARPIPIPIGTVGRTICDAWPVSFHRCCRTEHCMPAEYVSRNQNFIVSVCAAGDNLALSREANQCQELQVEGYIMLDNCLALVL